MEFIISTKNRIDFYEQLYQFSRINLFTVREVTFNGIQEDEEKLLAVVDDQSVAQLTEEQIEALRHLIIPVNTGMLQQTGAMH